MNDASCLTLVINLTRAPDRLARIGKRLDELAMPWQRVEAVDGQLLTPAQWAQFDKAEFSKRHGMTPWANEVGCYLSHLRAIDDFLTSSAERALVLEDDVGLSEDVSATLAALAQCAQRWDVVKLSKVHRGSPRAVFTLSNGPALCLMRTRCTGASAYVINRHAAKVLAHRLLPMSLPFDHAYVRGWALDLRVRLVEPPPCQHDTGVVTTLGDSSQWAARKFGGLQRLRAHAFRVRDDFARWRHASREWALENEWTRGPSPQG